MSLATAAPAPAGDAPLGSGVPAVPEGYRPHLDGLRTVAVYLVVVFHAGVDELRGGFIGVDVFFVLSGYLVTQVLMRDLAVDRRVRFGRFYARRVRRLLPASALAILGTAVAYSWVVSPVEVSESIDAFRAALLYVANWFFLAESTDYFAGGQAQSPVLHFWSLAVEEQFYLVWPLVLAGLTALASRAGARMWTLVRVAVAGTAAASLAWAWHLSAASPDHAYYGTDARVYQLLAGALVAMTPSLATRFRRLDRLAGPVALVALVGLVVVATDVVPGRPVLRGVLTCGLTVALLISLERGGGAARTLLAHKPMVELGRISYGTYLWHWPVIVIAGRLGDFGPWQMVVIASVVASGLAALSAMLVELPVREPGRLDRVPRVVIVSGLASSLVLALVVVRPLTEASSGRPAPGPVPETAADVLLTPLPDDFDEAAIQAEMFAADIDCVPATGEGCTVVRGEGPHVVLIGDSNAVMLQGAMTAMAEAEDLTLTIAADPGCAWQAGYFYDSHPDKRDACEQLEQRVYGEILDELQPDLVVAVNVREWSTLSRPAFTGSDQEQALRSATEDSVERILASSARLVVIEPIPRGTRDPNPLHCLGTATYQEECRFASPTEPYWVETDLRALAAANDGMWTIDLDRTVCPNLPTCDPIIDGVVVHWDDAHLTRRFGLSLADDLARELRTTGALGP